MSDSLTHRAMEFESQLNELAPDSGSETPSEENITHQAKKFYQAMESLAPDSGSETPSEENITHQAKLFNQYMDYFINNPPSPGGGGTDGQFFPMNMIEYVLPTMTLTYNGEEI